MSPIKAPPNLPELVRTAFNKARPSGDVNFYPTQVTLVDVNSIPFQLRFSPSLANKPKAPQPSENAGLPAEPPATKKKPVFDPFDNPSPAMLICPLPPHHNLVLNKFAIVPEHFILSTKEYKEQTHLLEKEDLEAVRECIEVYERYVAGGAGGEEGRKKNVKKEEEEEEEDVKEEEPKLFAFFNCGEHSGASQPHRHLQLLVVEKMRKGLEGVETGMEMGTETKEEKKQKKKKWEVLAQKLVDNKETEGKLLPFKTFAERLTPDMSGEEVHEVYLRLYRRAREAVRGYYQLSLQQSRVSQQPQQGSTTMKGAAAAEEEEKADDEIQTGGEATISYNLAMTRDVMVIVPRLAEGSAITEKDPETGGEEEVVVGKLALNGTVLAGTALVKSQREWDALRRNPEKVGELLRVIGVPNDDCEGGVRSPGRKGVL
ncbi:5',5'''-P-1,P-4-tetraphosphate phosphorylase [Neurospora intermedia]|uniref:5',5'''-P-1,P-4-tetraphosphate phosphorylase n=1 Tax=Neurospora intermedia TaxID=5142 RepID=A0ABR3DK13_NEUIN